MSGSKTKRKIDVDVLKLISAVKDHDCIWSPENKNYSKRGKATVRAWMDVVQKVGKEGTDLRAKWKNLKDGYRKELKKNYIDGQYRGIWQYFEELDFLRNSVTKYVMDKTEEETFSDDEINEEVQEVIRASPAAKRKADYDCIKLIAEIKKHKCLWKRSRYGYATQIVHHQAWKEISGKLEKPVSQLRRKWSNLRYTYKKELLNNYFDGEYMGTWQYFNLLNFLKLVKDDEDETDYNNEELPSEDEQSEPEMAEPQFETDIENQVKVEVERVDDVDDIDYLNETYQEVSIPEDRPTNENDVDDIDYLNETYQEVSITEDRPTNEDDEYDLMFLKSLVLFFRGLDPVRKLVLRSKIQDMIMKELASPS